VAAANYSSDETAAAANGSFDMSRDEVKGVPTAVRLGRVDVIGREIKIHVARQALGERFGAVRTRARVGDGAPAERTIENETQVFRLKVWANRLEKSEAESVHGRDRFARSFGNSAIELRLSQGKFLVS
jgi:hypothetical protein